MKPRTVMALPPHLVGGIGDTPEPRKRTTAGEYQAKYRKARDEEGLREVRGIYLKPALHAQVRAFARSLKAL